MSRRRILALGAILLVAGVAVAIVLTQTDGHTANAAGGGVPAGFTTATVERRTLAERTTVDGTLGYAGAAEVYDRLGGTFTWLPAVGAVVLRGGTLFKINNLPVVLMYGSVPAYRALSEGVSDGPDVGELNANLGALGYDSEGAIGVSEHFGAATAAAVRRWQHAEGLAETGKVELGRVVFAPGARRVTTVHVVVGQDPPGAESEAQPPASPSGGAPSGKSPGSPSGSNGSPQPSQPSKSKKPSSPAKSPAHQSHPKAAPSPKPKASQASPKSSPSSGTGSPSSSKESDPPGKEGSGSAGGAPELVLSTTADEQIVTLQLKATQQELAHEGERVPVALPDGSTVNGRVSEVGTVASESSESEKSGEKGGAPGGSSGNGENATIAVKVTLDRPVPRLDKAPVSVELVKSIRHDVLAVPATALVPTGGGVFAVQALAGRRRVELPVTPGMFADGYVQVEGPGLHEGLVVLEPQ
jgi:peptidoglycan hydrolase-like protein with peptidoglycan-binding domain